MVSVQSDHGEVYLSTTEAFQLQERDEQSRLRIESEVDCQEEADGDAHANPAVIEIVHCATNVRQVQITLGNTDEN